MHLWVFIFNRENWCGDGSPKGRSLWRRLICMSWWWGWTSKKEKVVASPGSPWIVVIVMDLMEGEGGGGAADFREEKWGLLSDGRRRSVWRLRREMRLGSRDLFWSRQRWRRGGGLERIFERRLGLNEIWEDFFNSPSLTNWVGPLFFYVASVDRFGQAGAQTKIDLSNPNEPIKTDRSNLWPNWTGLFHIKIAGLLGFSSVLYGQPYCMVFNHPQAKELINGAISELINCAWLDVWWCNVDTQGHKYLQKTL